MRRIETATTFMLVRLVLATLVGVWAAACVSSARAQDVQPPRYVALLSAGVPLRLTQHEDLGQDRRAPAFADGLFGYVLRGPASYRHGFGVGVSTNLARDGHYVQPIYAGQQLVLMPAYLGYLELGRDVPLLAHAGLPILFGEGRAFGLELGAALGYRLLAGLGAFAEVDLSTYVGTRSTLHVLASLELGVIIDYEVLP